MLLRFFYLGLGLLSLFTLIYYIINSYSSQHFTSKTDQSLIDLSDVTIMMPVYNEKVEIFTESIDSVAKQGCKFIVVGDHSLEPYKTMVEARGGTFIHQEAHSGKKKAMVLGIKSVHTKYVMMTDSDTILPDNAASSMMSHFVDNVGGVGANLTIKKTGSMLSYSSEFVERSREVVFRAMSAHGSVMNLDGACAMYKTDLIKPFILSPEFSDFKVLGKPSILGEDWMMTGYIIRNGYKAVKDYNTKVQCYPQENNKKFMRQNLRWARSNWIRFGRELVNGTAMKAGWFYTFELLFTYLLPVVTLGFGLFRLFSFLALHPSADPVTVLMNLVLVGGSYGVHTHIVGRLGILGANVGGTTIFLATVSQRINSERLKTIAYGSFAILVMFITNIYGLFTFWKSKDWMTR